MLRQTSHSGKTLVLFALIAVVALGGPAGRALAFRLAGTGPTALLSEEEEVLKAVQDFFDAMAARDAEAMRRVTLPEGRFFSMREEQGAAHMRSITNAEFAQQLAAAKENFLERMWKPQVLRHGRIAVVWTPYDFHRDARFSHCGVDAFNLVKTDEGWKITGGVYTVEPTGCAPSPLGPPKFDAPPPR